MLPGGWSLAGEKLAGHPEQTRMPAGLLLVHPIGRAYQEPDDKGRMELAELQQHQAKCGSAAETQQPEDYLTQHPFLAWQTFTRPLFES